MWITMSATTILVLAFRMSTPTCPTATSPTLSSDLKNDVNLIVEIKGHETDQELAKYAGAERWVSAVNNWNELGRWDFHVCRDPQLLEREIRYIVQSSE